VTQLDTHRVNHQKNTTDKNEAESFGHGLAGMSSSGWSAGNACWPDDASANKHATNDTVTNAKRTHAVTYVSSSSLSPWQNKHQKVISKYSHCCNNQINWWKNNTEMIYVCSRGQNRKFSQYNILTICNSSSVFQPAFHTTDEFSVCVVVNQYNIYKAQNVSNQTKLEASINKLPPLQW